MKQRVLIASVLAACLAPCTTVRALDIGLEAELRLDSSDNIGRSDVGSEEDGQIGYALFGVFGEQRGRFLQGGFSGELETRRLLSDNDAEASTLNNFYGAANLLLSRSFSWYFADVLGTVRTGDGILPVDDDEITARRNVFVTGPSFNYSLDSFSTVNAQVLYFNQSQDDRDLASLVTTQLDWRQDTSGGNTFGVSVNNIFTDEPTGDDDEEIDSDNNRFSANVFWERARGRMNYYGSLGATRYDVNEAVINGANAAFRISRQFTAVSDLSFSIGTDLSDENISTIDSLINDGAGVEPEAAGVFQRNSASLIYSFGGARTSVETGFVATDAQYQSLSGISDQFDATLEDNLTLAVYGVLSRRFTSRISTDLGLRFENQSFANRPDESDSIVANASIGFQINQSFNLGLGVRTARSEGINTREADVPGEDGAFETIENRAQIQLRWAPPSRATKETVVQLKQLLR